MRVWPSGLGLALLALSVAAACGSAPSTPQAQSRQLIVLAELGAQTGIRLVTPSGQVVANYAFAFDHGLPHAVAGDRVFVTTMDGHLKAIGRDGTVEDLGLLGRSSRVVPSPDGKRWLWATFDENGGPEVTSQIHVAGIGLADRVVERYTANSVLLRPYAWTAAGVFIEQARTGIGGYFPFGTPVGPIHRLDLDTGKTTPLAATDGCILGDVARDGTIACFVAVTDAARALRLVAPSGGTKNVALPRPQFTIPGEAWFDPSGTIVMAAGATGGGNGFVHAEPLTEEYTTYLVRLDSSLAQFGPAGVRPAFGASSWLSSQQVVLWRPEGAAGGEAGLYILDMNGHSNFIADPGIPVGVLS